jgi:cytochrome c peroxidase
MRIAVCNFLLIIGGGALAACGALLFSACGAHNGCDPALGVNAQECALIEAMALPATLPASPGNKYADDDGAAMLGFALFFRTNFGDGIGCASCHEPEATFADARQVAQGKGVGARNTPTVFNGARLERVFFWDGRADSMWSQPLFAVENPNEMASSRLALAHALASDDTLSGAYTGVFGAMPDISALPAEGKPGDPAWEAMSANDQDAVNRIAANFGKALEAYERKNTSTDAPLDTYLRGDKTAISDLAKQGILAFVRDGCVSCHAGAAMTDEHFHKVDFPTLPGAAPDEGRASGAVTLAANPFNLAGPYADAPQPVDTSDRTPFAFRTPPLRNVGKTAPYGHDGALATLSDVLALHAPKAADRAALLAFLLALSGGYPSPPWSDWPQPQ